MSSTRLCILFMIFSCLSACATTKTTASAPKKVVAVQEKPALSDKELGRQYLLGLGVAKDNVKAFYHFKRAADHGDALAQNEVAYLYASGTGVPEDYANALKYYQKAADQGLASAQYNVGFFYLHGLGVPVNEEMARTWIAKAADNGFEPAVKLLRDLNAKQHA